MRNFGITDISAATGLSLTHTVTQARHERARYCLSQCTAYRPVEYSTARKVSVMCFTLPLVGSLASESSCRAVPVRSSTKLQNSGITARLTN